MESDRQEDSREMYSPDEQGEYMLLDGTPRFSVQGLSDTLADVGEGITEPPGRGICHDIRGDDGRSPWSAMSPCILLEHGNGNAHIEE